MPELQTVHWERAGRVARVVLQRPEVRNAFDDVMISELRQVFGELRDDSAVRIVVLTGEGSAFCAGADLRWMGRVVDFSYEENLKDSVNLAQLLREIYELPKPVVARVNGPAIGGGTGLVAVCDVAVAADSAIFSFSEVKIGLVPACIAPYVLRRVGERYAREYFLTGERLSAERALECGLVNRVVLAGELDAEVEDYLAQLGSSGPQAMDTCKRMLRQVAELDLDRAGPLTAELITRLRMSSEGQAGMRAFLDHRRPPWWPEE